MISSDGIIASFTSDGIEPPLWLGLLLDLLHRVWRVFSVLATEPSDGFLVSVSSDIHVISVAHPLA